ncbi:hypothetical protein [Leptospira kanakyensis]|uniref:Restriction endonuclease n=1 Tax=Leptospira kanakyensis TaxID=2484968 RepID=A0A6N4QGE8_9LEPT|nr:hypothetical protein [Leptospira kanakyensis]TGK45970.1 hypothetical protein EHQ11_19680 [Leptospira kanakyensis]TGK70610.1 hypothetical protein EHQ18_09170 [Leptospira kanakyensis]
MIPENHILNSAYSISIEYRKELEVVIEEFSKKISPKELKALKSKLGLNSNKHTLESYIQSATETTVVRYFLNNFSENFQYEPSLNFGSNNNIECQILENGNAYNIEVKTPSYYTKEKDGNEKGLNFSTTGRFRNSIELFNSFKNIFKPNEFNISKRMDNNLKDFLISANSKFPNKYPLKHLNILVVACGDSEDFQNFDNYIEDVGGFFRHDSYINQNLYNKVDCIVLSNLYYKHSPKFNRMTKESWDFSKAFNIIYTNPFRKNKESDLLNRLLSMIPNYTIEYEEFHNEWLQKNKFTFYIMKHFIHKELGEKQGKSVF